MVLSGYILRRVLEAIPTVFAVIIFTFVLIHAAPGDPAAFLAGEQASTEYVAQIRREYGFDKPMLEQLGIYLSKVLRGDFGYSFMESAPAFQVVVDRIPATLLLIFPSIFLSLIIGIPLGIIAARKYPSKTSELTSMTSLVLFSTPIFVFGLMLMIIFGIHVKVFPITGMVGIYGATGVTYIIDVLSHLFLPMLTLTFIWGLPQFVRITMSSVIEVSKEDFITTARAIGLGEKEVFNRHAFRNALLPVVTMAGLWVSFAISGAVFTETVFTWPGIGRLMYDSISYRDYPVLMVVFILTSVSVTFATLITDIVCAIIDPRVRYR